MCTKKQSRLLRQLGLFHDLSFCVSENVSRQLERVPSSSFSGVLRTPIPLFVHVTLALHTASQKGKKREDSKAWQKASLAAQFCRDLWTQIFAPLFLSVDVSPFLSRVRPAPFQHDLQAQ